MFRVCFWLWTRIKTILPLINRLINNQWSSAGCWPRINHMLLQLINVVCSCLSVSVAVSRRWCTDVVFMQPGVKVNGVYTVMSCCSNSCCQTSVKLLVTFAFQRTTRAQDHWAAVTRLQTSHQTWPPNRPDLSSVDYRLLRAIQECAYQKQQRMSNIVDELWSLTEWHIIFHKVG